MKNLSNPQDPNVLNEVEVLSAQSSSRSDTDAICEAQTKRSYVPAMVIEGQAIQLAELVNMTHNEPEDLLPRSDPLNEALAVSDCLMDYMAGEFPPEDIYAYFPDTFEVEHGVAYIFLNLHQQSSEEGFTEFQGLLDELQGFMGQNDKRESAKICTEVIEWTLWLKPREVKPSVYSLLVLVRDCLDVEESEALMKQVHSVANKHEDVAGNVMAFVRYLDCLFMDKLVEPKANPFFFEGADAIGLPVDPAHWTVLHDLSAVMLHFNALRGDDIDDIDKFVFQVHMPSWEFEIDGNRVGLAFGNPVSSFALLDEVDQFLFPPTGALIAHLPRVAKSHENLVGYFERGIISANVMKSILFDLYRTTFAFVYLTQRQKVQFKEFLLFWNQFIDLSALMSVVEYHWEEGRSVFGRIDLPEIDSIMAGRSLVEFCS